MIWQGAGLSGGVCVGNSNSTGHRVIWLVVGLPGGRGCTHNGWFLESEYIYPHTPLHFTSLGSTVKNTLLGLLSTLPTFSKAILYEDSLGDWIGERFE